jgi:hypothetical protein
VYHAVSTIGIDQSATTNQPPENTLRENKEPEMPESKAKKKETKTPRPKLTPKEEAELALASIRDSWQSLGETKDSIRSEVGEITCKLLIAGKPITLDSLREELQNDVEQLEQEEKHKMNLHWYLKKGALAYLNRLQDRITQ